MRVFSFILCVFFGSLFAAEWETDDLFELENAPPSIYPFSASGEYLSVNKADFRTSGLEDSNLVYKQWGAAFAYTHPFCETWGLILGAGWIGTEVDMKNNPDFNETIFNYVNGSIGAFTNAFPDWTWTLTLAAFLDTEEFSFADYALYQGVLWGKYDFCRYLEFDVGMILEVGLNKERVWPIFGFIYHPSPNWRINAVYPINMAIEYDITQCFKIAGSLRILRNRHRVQSDEPNPMGIFQYQTWGGEVDLIYSPFEWASLKGFAGSTTDGDLKMTNSQDKHGRHFKFKGSFYAGASAILSF